VALYSRQSKIKCRRTSHFTEEPPHLKLGYFAALQPSSTRLRKSLSEFCGLSKRTEHQALYDNVPILVLRVWRQSILDHNLAGLLKEKTAAAA
jgi:hypothetical protein